MRSDHPGLILVQVFVYLQEYLMVQTLQTEMIIKKIKQNKKGAFEVGTKKIN